MSELCDSIFIYVQVFQRCFFSGFFIIDDVTMWKDLDPDPNWGKFQNPNPNVFRSSWVWTQANHQHCHQIASTFVGASGPHRNACIEEGETCISRKLIVKLLILNSVSDRTPCSPSPFTSRSPAWREKRSSGKLDGLCDAPLISSLLNLTFLFCTYCSVDSYLYFNVFYFLLFGVLLILAL